MASFSMRRFSFSSPFSLWTADRSIPHDSCPIIFLGGSVANFQRGFDSINVPSVLTTLVTDELNFPNLSMVGVDDRAAAYTAVDYLIRQGHRKIAVLGGPVTSYPSVMRREGAQQAMRDAGILFSDKLYGLSNYDFESAYHLSLIHI